MPRGKSENVKPENANGLDKVALAFNASDAFILAVDTYCENNENMTRAEMGKRAVAALVGYDLAGEPLTTRRTKLSGLTPEEKKARAAEKAKFERDSRKEIETLYQAGQKEQAIAALEAYLKRKQGL